MLSGGGKISVAMIASNLEINGISSVIMNYCSRIDLEQFRIVLLVGKGVAPAHRSLCDRLGIKVVELPRRKKDPARYYMALNRALGENHFDIVHVHGSQASIALELMLAMLRGVKVRIAHSHSTSCDIMILHRMMKPVLRAVCTHGFACSETAGRWLFGDQPYVVIPNGICADQFRFNESWRRKIREKLGIENAYVLGHVGGLCDTKNHAYLLDVFRAVAARRDDAVLLMVGTGPMREEIEARVERHPYRDRIIMYGETPEPEKMYMAMDAFVFPSKYEGLPMTLLEAQTSGLPCVISDAVTDEAVLSGNVKKLSIGVDAEVWAEEIVGLAQGDRGAFFDAQRAAIAKYDISRNVRLLEELYREYAKR